MTTLNSKRRKLIIRASIALLALAFWVLGDVKRNYWIEDSPDGRFSTSLSVSRGWRNDSIGGWFFLYVRDNKTGETVLATTHPRLCGWSRIALNDIEWEKNSRRFIGLWEIRSNGVHKQFFTLEREPLRVKAGPPACRAS